MAVLARQEHLLHQIFYQVILNTYPGKPARRHQVRPQRLTIFAEHFDGKKASIYCLAICCGRAGVRGEMAPHPDPGLPGHHRISPLLCVHKLIFAALLQPLDQILAQIGSLVPPLEWLDIKYLRLREGCACLPIHTHPRREQQGCEQHWYPCSRRPLPPQRQYPSDSALEFDMHPERRNYHWPAGLVISRIDNILEVGPQEYTSPYMRSVVAIHQIFT